MAINPNVNKVQYGNNVLIDLTDDDVTADKVLSSVTKVHLKDGSQVAGSCTYDADTSDADASASDILLNKTAYVNGSKVTGSYVGVTAKIFTFSPAAAVANQDITVVSGDPDVAAHYTDANAMVTVRKITNNTVRGTSFIMGSNHSFGVDTSLYMNYNGTTNNVGTSSNALTSVITSGVGVYCNSNGDIIVHCASLQNNFGGADYIITFTW